MCCTCCGMQSLRLLTVGFQLIFKFYPLDTFQIASSWSPTSPFCITTPPDVSMSNFPQPEGFSLDQCRVLLLYHHGQGARILKLWETQGPNYCLLPLIIPSKKKRRKTQLSLSPVPHPDIPLNSASGTTCRAAACLGICRMDLGIAVSWLWFQSLWKD